MKRCSLSVQSGDFRKSFECLPWYKSWPLLAFPPSFSSSSPSPTHLSRRYEALIHQSDIIRQRSTEALLYEQTTPLPNPQSHRSSLAKSGYLRPPAFNNYQEENLPKDRGHLIWPHETHIKVDEVERDDGKAWKRQRDCLLLAAEASWRTEAGINSGSHFRAWSTYSLHSLRIWDIQYTIQSLPSHSTAKPV